MKPLITDLIAKWFPLTAALSPPGTITFSHSLYTNTKTCNLNIERCFPRVFVNSIIIGIPSRNNETIYSVIARLSWRSFEAQFSSLKLFFFRAKTKRVEAESDYGLSFSFVVLCVIVN